MIQQLHACHVPRKSGLQGVESCLFIQHLVQHSRDSFMQVKEFFFTLFAEPLQLSWASLTLQWVAVFL